MIDLAQIIFEDLQHANVITEAQVRARYELLFSQDEITKALDRMEALGIRKLIMYRDLTFVEVGVSIDRKAELLGNVYFARGVQLYDRDNTHIPWLPRPKTDEDVQQMSEGENT